MGVTHREAAEELARRDAVLAGLVARHGPMRVPAAPPAARRFESLANAIASQQLHGRAAETIWARARSKIDGPFTAEAVLEVPLLAWRDAGHAHIVEARYVGFWWSFVPRRGRLGAG